MSSSIGESLRTTVSNTGNRKHHASVVRWCTGTRGQLRFKTAWGSINPRWGGGSVSGNLGPSTQVVARILTGVLSVFPWPIACKTRWR
jgi:hypothetical protein